MKYRIEYSTTFKRSYKLAKNGSWRCTGSVGSD